MKTGRSLRFRLVVSYVALALVLLSVTGYVFANALGTYADSVQKAHMDAALEQAAMIIDDAQGQKLSPAETVAFLRQKLPDLDIGLEQGPPEKADILAAQIIQAPGKGVLIFTRTPAKTSFTLPAGKGSPAMYYRFTTEPSAGLVLTSLYRQVLAVLVAALLLSGLAGWLLSRWLSRPVLRLVAATEAIAGGNFLHAVDRTGIAELDRLADQFNAMVLHLRESFRALAADRDTAQRFAADAAHELKTPVTTLRAYYEVLAEHPERLQRVAPAIARQIGRMEWIISGLLQMANLGEGGGIVLESDDLHTVLQRMALAYQAQAEASGHRLITSWPDGPVPVVLDHRLLELAVDNLIANACKYTAPGGQLALMLECDGSHAVITVVDSGNGISPEELAHSFDRFHRGVDTQSIPGSGLGLAIAREAVQQMGGTLTAESEVGAGSRFFIRLPILPPADAGRPK